MKLLWMMYVMQMELNEIGVDDVNVDDVCDVGEVHIGDVGDVTDIARDVGDVDDVCDDGVDVDEVDADDVGDARDVGGVMYMKWKVEFGSSVLGKTVCRSGEYSNRHIKVWNGLRENQKHLQSDPEWCLWHFSGLFSQIHLLNQHVFPKF